jgi:hypothetical protein
MEKFMKNTSHGKDVTGFTKPGKHRILLNPLTFLRKISLIRNPEPGYPMLTDKTTGDLFRTISCHKEE